MARLLGIVARVSVPALLLLAPSVSNAQAASAVEHRPVVVVSATAEVDVPPDRAHLTLVVESRARTSQAAATDNARVQRAVLDAVRRQGIPASQVRTQALTIAPEYEYPRDGGKPTVVGYVARNAVAVEVRDLARIAGVVDAALAQGATSVDGPRFALANPDAPRREALEAAVRRAMGEAEVIARASGGRLGAVLEVVSGDESPGIPVGVRGAMFRADATTVETPVETGTITVRASVRVRVALEAAP